MGDPAGAEEVRAAGAVLWRPRAGTQVGQDVEVALVHRPRYDDWAFPKGKAAPGEHPLLTAVREVTEETGLRPVLGRQLPHMFYLAAGRPKRVDYWAATPAAPQAQEHIPNGGAVSRAHAGLAPPAQAEPVQAEPVQAEPVQAEPVQAKPVQAKPVQAKPVQAKPVQAERVQAEFVPNDEVDKLEWLPVAEAAQRLSYERDVGPAPRIRQRARVDGPLHLPAACLRGAKAGLAGRRPAAAA